MFNPQKYDGLVYPLRLGEIDDVHSNMVTRTRYTKQDILLSVMKIILFDRNSFVLTSIHGRFTMKQMISDSVSLTAANALLSSVCTYSSEGIVLADGKNGISFANTAFQRMTGYTSRELFGRSMEDFRPEGYGDSFFERMREKLSEQGKWTGDLWSRRKEGDYFLARVTVIRVQEESGEEHLCYLYNDISKVREAEAKLRHSVNHDPLTDLPNRILLLERVEAAIMQASRKNRGLSLLIVDLDDFKRINDGLGHGIGDSVIKLAANRIQSTIRIGDSVARSGGDEFTVLLPDIRSASEAKEIAERIIEVLAEPFVMRDTSIYLGATTGISVYPDDGTLAQTLMRNADLALLRAKQHCKGTYQFFTPDLNERAQRRIQLEEIVRSALDDELIQVYFQPVIDMESGKLASSEALARLFHPEKGEISPGQFIPLAEESGLIYRLGAYVFEKACKQYANWLQHGVVKASVAVNLSARQFIQPDLLQNMLAILERTGLPPQHVTIEITENSIMEDIEDSIKILRSFKDVGMKISIDDFGTGYSSLSYLKTLPVDQLKIDRSFIRDLMFRDNQAAIVTAIISMAHSMNMRVVAEGVETKQQFDFLKRSSCDFVQGFYFSKPLSVENAQPHFEKETLFFNGS